MDDWLGYLKRGLSRDLPEDGIAEDRGYTSTRASLSNLRPFVERHWRKGLVGALLVLLTTLLAFPQPLLMRYLISAPDIKDPKKIPDQEALNELMTMAGREAFKAKIASWDELGHRHMAERLSERLLSHVMLQVLDEKWKDHLFELDHLRTGIQYRAWGQKDPLIEYKREAFDMFVDLMNDIRSTFTERFFKFLSATSSHDGTLRCKTFHMFGLLFHKTLRDKHGEIGINVAGIFKHFI